MVFVPIGNAMGTNEFNVHFFTSATSQVYDEPADHPADVTEEWQLVSSSSSTDGEPAPAAFIVVCAGAVTLWSCTVVVTYCFEYPAS